ncbi:amylo-alpha-1,6-glucosidase [uncultured Clostridium sp.]|uniref:amylo-alpha-1,6-glucosidase n=1 Tax=uncultured Clostridium sp. TaxID=59620 RepID=UPI0025E4A83B|nr:amylo-alpha-1,6-glucosidase [uncultured Clostridium sp.]
MKFIYGKNDWSSMERGQENCYLLTNGLGGFSSLTMSGCSARNDHAFMMACLKAPNNRYNMILNLGEKIIAENNIYDLMTAEFLDPQKNRSGYQYESIFSFEDIPQWIYDVDGVEVNKQIAMKQKENTIAVKYQINNRREKSIKFEVTPYMEFVQKGDTLKKEQKFVVDEASVKSNNMTLYYKSNGTVKIYDTQYEDDVFFAQDERDGREKCGCVAHNHNLYLHIPQKEKREFYIIYSMDEIKESADEFARIVGEDKEDYNELAEKVMASFNEKFWNEEDECLKDIVSGSSDGRDTYNKHENQIRCNMIWALSMNFTMLDQDKELKVLDTVFEKLYTPYGLRTLAMDDEEFKGFYGGSMFERDMAYHQGTVWVYPLGAYYAAYLKVHEYSKECVETVKNQLLVMEAALREGCIGQLPEIYDGKNPSISKGCFAQAWSVGEILKVYYLLENRGK